ncbi:MFS general substrate transporter [Hesseltinella vesiculosa]|uniref:MFS general substrate transporter n=1 Tax=Hesseltinella vesiculosa TaxID=101127 RepID=A0A1X2GGQ9_9FUNG|nr:MFS general substrate transporter [Hesseltinella vesiculosa]
MSEIQSQSPGTPLKVDPETKLDHTPTPPIPSPVSMKDQEDEVHSTGKEIPEKPIEVEEFQEMPFGWVIVIGATLVQITSYGTITSWGVMQNYFEKYYFGQDKQLDLSFVGTISLIFIYGSAPISQLLISWLGIRTSMMIGSACVSLGLITAGWAFEIWHLYLSQGILFGLGASIMYFCIMNVVPAWFRKHQGLALGIVAAGSGIGGLAIPFIMTPINDSLGPGWTYRILGLICLACDIVAVMIVKPRAPVPHQRKKFSDIVQLDVLKNINMVLFSLGSMMSLLGYFIPYFFLPSYATSKGLSDQQGSAMIAVSSACNFIGRIIAGMVADRFGAVNTNVIFTLMGSLSSFLIWTFAETYGSLMAYSAIFGLFCGSYFSLLSPILTKIVGLEKYPTALSVLLISNIVSVFGPNIATAIENNVNSPRYFSYKMFAGVTYLLGAMILFILKIRLNKHIFSKV